MLKYHYIGFALLNISLIIHIFEVYGIELENEAQDKGPLQRAGIFDLVKFPVSMVV